MKIAVASSSGIRVDRHFGSAEQFWIYENGEKGIDFVEVRKSPVPAGNCSGSEEAVALAARLLSDCGIIAANRIGHTPRQVFLETRAEVVETEGDISAALIGIRKWIERKERYRVQRSEDGAAASERAS
jgi:nitrogenase molybdenum-iron protein NifN